jgi:hypothetical protein
MYSTIGDYLYNPYNENKEGFSKVVKRPPVLETFEKPGNVNKEGFVHDKRGMGGSVGRGGIEKHIEKNIERYEKETSNSPIPLDAPELPSEGGANPKIWGPPFWFTLHNMSAHYPMEASPIVQSRMKNRILAIPYELPCQNCRVHASAFIESKKESLDEIVKGRHSLGKFFVDFHNKVNARYGKPQWTYEQAYKKYRKTNIVM